MTIYAQLDTSTLQEFDGPVAGTFFDGGGSEINVLHPDFGATYSSPGVVSNGSAVLQAAFDRAAGAGGIGTIRIPGGYTFLLTSDVIVDPTLTSAVGISVDARNARFAVHGTGRVGIKRLAAQFPNSGTLNFRFRWTGGYFYSDDNATGQTGIQFSAGYNCVFRDIDFAGLDTGLDMIMLLNTLVESCMASNCTTYGFRARSGDELAAWRATGGPNGVANAVNAQCNSTVFSKCRVYAKADSHSCYYITGSSGCVVRESIAEGASPQYAVYFDHAGLRPLDPNDPNDARLNPTVKDFTVDGLHCESNPPASEALIYLRHIGQSWIDRIWHQGPGCVIESAVTTVGGAKVVVGDIPGYLPGGLSTGSYMIRGNSDWDFRGLLGNGTIDMGAVDIATPTLPAGSPAPVGSTSQWAGNVGAQLPTYWWQRRMSTAAELGGSYLTLQGREMYIKSGQFIGSFMRWVKHRENDIGHASLDVFCPRGIYAAEEVKARAVTAAETLQVRGGALVTGILSVTALISTVLNPGDETTHTISVANATVESAVSIDTNSTLPPGLHVVQKGVWSAGVVTFVLKNNSASSLALVQKSFRATVINF